MIKDGYNTSCSTVFLSFATAFILQGGNWRRRAVKGLITFLRLWGMYLPYSHWSCILWYIFRVEPGTDHLLEGKVCVTVFVINVLFLISRRILESERAEICCHFSGNFKMLKIRGFLRPICLQAWQWFCLKKLFAQIHSPLNRSFCKRPENINVSEDHDNTRK